MATTEKWAGSLERAIPITLALILGLIVIMALKSDFDKHPDERHHYDAAKFYYNHWLPPQVGAPETADSYSKYGASYLNELDLVYLLAGKFTILLSPLITKKYVAMRLFNTLLFILLLLYCTLIMERRLIFIVALITPQVWYIFSYFNNDAISFSISIIMICELANDNSFFQRSLRAVNSSQFICGGVMMGLLLGLLFLCKRNYYIFIAFILFLIIWQIGEERGTVRKQILLRYLFVIGLGLSIFSLRYVYDVAINGWDKADKMAAYAEKTALPSYKSSVADTPDSAWGLHLRAKGVKYYELFSKFRWHRISFRSFFGVYDYMEIKSSPWYYFLVFFIVCLFSIYIICSVLIKGEGRDKIFMVMVLGFIFITIFISTYHSWINDFQAQGRYLFPILPMIGLLLYGNRKILNRSLVSIFVICLCGLSFYSFIFTGLSKMINPVT